MFKPLVIYHANCADGFGAAFAAWLKLGDDAEYVPCQYGEQANTWMERHNAEVTGRDVYILDFSFNRQTMEDFFELANRVVWLDHHKTAFEVRGLDPSITYLESGPTPNKGNFIILDNYKSGAYLAWEYFRPGTKVPLFIRHIDDYDRWQFKIEGTKAFQKALWSYAPWSFENWRAYLYFGVKALDEGAWRAYTRFIAEGEAILRAHDQNVQAVVKNVARKCSIVPSVIDSSASYKAPWVWWHDEEHGDTCGANGLAANCPPHLTSDVGHELANQSGTFGLCWTLGKTDLIAKCSLRSNGDYDVSAIAESFGGGGHRNAAGFEVDIHTLLGWIK